MREGLAEFYKNELHSLEKTAEIEYCAPLVITFCGRFKTGKSSLINALLGSNILPTRAITATAVVTRITYGRKKNAYITEGGDIRQVSFETAYEHITFDRDRPAGEASDVLFELPLKWLKGVMLVDTPGLNDYPELEALSRRELEKTDIAVIVCDASALLGQYEKSLVEELDKKLGGNIAFVINRINLLNTKEEINEVNRLAKELLDGLGNEPLGRGVVYSLCSAEGNVALNGFDKWLKGILRHNAYQFKEIRHYAAAVERLEEFEAQIEFDVTMLKTEISELEAKAQREREEKEKRHRNFITDLKSRLFDAYRSDTVPILGGEHEALLTALQELAYSSDKEYRKKSKEVMKEYSLAIMKDTEDFFVKKLKGSGFSIGVPYSSIKKMLDDIEAPSRKYLPLKRSAADILLFRHPKIDISAENTRNFFLSEVLTPLNGFFREAYDSLLKEIDGSKPDLTSSYRGVLEDCHSVLSDLDWIRCQIKGLVKTKRQSLDRLIHSKPAKRWILSKIAEWIGNIF